MSKESHHLEFSKDSLGTDQALKYIWEFFQGHTFWIARISHWPDNSKGPITDRPIWQIFTSRRTIARAWKTKNEISSNPKSTEYQSCHLTSFFLKKVISVKKRLIWLAGNYLFAVLLTRHEKYVLEHWTWSKVVKQVCVYNSFWKSLHITGYYFWDRLRNFLHKFTRIVLSVHKLNKLGKFW